MSGKQMQKITVALAGNPNVGKSTLFNSLTGMRQHTGNWPGKTVGIATGTCTRGDTQYCFVDLPGTYSLLGSSEDEQLAAEFITSNQADCTVIVCDGSCLERSLILALQILSRTQRAVVCVNLMDEARRKGIFVDDAQLSEMLGVPVVLTSAGCKQGIRQLLAQISYISGEITGHPAEWDNPIAAAEEISATCVKRTANRSEDHTLRWDRILLSRRFGIPIMLGLLLLIIWLTVWGANYPSAILEELLDMGYRVFSRWFVWLPGWLHSLLLDGMYATSARVIAVMLPPMAIFFPLFTILEDIGYLPRMAFLLDGKMQRCGGCGKQALTLCMGLGCNAVGITGCRIIDSPRERLLGILTNAMVPCNGRFPTLILLGTLFFSGAGGALSVAGCVVMGVLGAAVSSGVLSRTALQHEPSAFVMEMPPFRKPRFGQILVRSLIDRTLSISGRALKVAAPAGALLWLLRSTGALTSFAAFLQPVGAVLGMSGAILAGFVLSFPANELLIPVIVMILKGADSLHAVDSVQTVLLENGLTWQMAVCMMLFSVFHWPCATALMTVHKETGSIKKTAAAFLLPTAVGLVLCFLLNLVFHMLC